MNLTQPSAGQACLVHSEATVFAFVSLKKDSIQKAIANFARNNISIKITQHKDMIIIEAIFRLYEIQNLAPCGLLLDVFKMKLNMFTFVVFKVYCQIVVDFGGTGPSGFKYLN